MSAFELLPILKIDFQNPAYILRVNLKNLKKYFTYDDTLRKAVSIITGILIAVFNTASGFIIVYFFCELSFGISHPEVWILILYLLPAVISGAGILKLCILIIEQALGTVKIEKYSYLRLVLMLSILVYLLILIFFFSFQMTGVISDKIIEIKNKFSR